MPNTLAHIGVQAILGRAAQPVADVKWVLVGCIIPDLSWILQVLLRRFDISLIDLRLYAVVQTSLLFCVILAAALALLSRHPGRTFLTLALGTLMHLLLDATQTKWGNGVLLWAPFDWTLLNFELYWPEDWPSYGLTLLGVVTVAVLWMREGPEPFTLHRPQIARLIPACALFLVWIAAPFAFMPQAEAANLHNTAVLRTAETRTGQAFSVDRNAVTISADGVVLLHSWVGETFVLEGQIPSDAKNVSLLGQFIAPDRIMVSDLYVHTAGPREWFSYAGLLAIVAWWAQGAWRGYRRPQDV